jgi:hypothetical protein
MLRLGCLKAVDTEKNEQLHKDLVKKHVKQTQRIPGRFASQIAQADYERVLFDRMQRHLHIGCFQFLVLNLEEDDFLDDLEEESAKAPSLNGFLLARLNLASLFPSMADLISVFSSFLDS